jgi:hypothetical protein
MLRYAVAIAVGFCLVLATIGKAVSVPPVVKAATMSTIVSPFELMLKAKDLPVEQFDVV